MLAISWTRLEGRMLKDAPAPGAIDLWCIDLDTLPEPMLDVFSLAEMERAKTYRFDLDRQRFLTGRWQIRLILGLYLNQPPEAVNLCPDERGKLYLAECPVPLAFNFTRSEGTGLLAVSGAGRIGVDLESVKDVKEMDLVVADYFSNLERQALTALECKEKLVAFYRGWTGKEALIKATGQGLSERLGEISVQISPDHPATLLAGTGIYSPEVWHLTAFIPLRGMLATVALDHPISAIRGWTLGGEIGEAIPRG